MKVDSKQLEHFARQIQQYTWNFDTQKPCRKVKYINNDAGESIKGELVQFDTALDKAVVISDANGHDSIGVWAEGGIKNGKEGFVIVGGSALFMLKNTTLSVHGNWIKTSDVAGRADASLADPPLGGVAQLDEHMQECGHCCETAGAGADVLVEGTIHLN